MTKRFIKGFFILIILVNRTQQQTKIGRKKIATGYIRRIPVPSFSEERPCLPTVRSCATSSKHIMSDKYLNKTTSKIYVLNIKVYKKLKNCHNFPEFFIQEKWSGSFMTSINCMAFKLGQLSILQISSII